MSTAPVHVPSPPPLILLLSMVDSKLGILGGVPEPFDKSSLSLAS